MNETSTSTIDGPDAAGRRERMRLSFDLDVDICVVGAGLAGRKTPRDGLARGGAGSAAAVVSLSLRASSRESHRLIPGRVMPRGTHETKAFFAHQRALDNL